MSNNSNAPFVSSKKYPLVGGISNSPFTDQRAVEAGGGSGGLGNVIYDGVTLSVDDGAGSSIIQDIDQGIEDFTIRNDAGEITLNSTTGITISAENENIFLNTEKEFVCTNTKTTAGELFKWVNDLDDPLIDNPTFKLSRVGTGATATDIIICENIELVTFAGNNSAVESKPLIRFSQIAGQNSEVRFENNPTVVGDVLRYAGGTIPRQLEWQPLNVENLIKPVNPLPYEQDTTRVFNTGTDAARGNVVQLFASTVSSGGTFTNTMTLESGPDEDKFNILMNSTKDEWFNITSQNVGSGTGTFVTEFKINASTYLQGAGNPKPTGRSSAMIFNNFIEFDFAGGVPHTSPLFAFRSQPSGVGGEYYQFLASVPSIDGAPIVPNTPVQNSVLTVVSGLGTIASPYIMQWIVPSGGGGGNLNTLDIEYDTSSSTLVLSDPVDGIISTTPIVSGRTILIESLVVNGQGTFSVFGLSNTTFPPPASTSIVGNNPPNVPLGSLGESLWTVGNTFRVTIGGKINDFDNNDNLVYQVISNRGQTSQNILNTFSLELSSVLNTAFGFTWVVLFTVRTLNAGAVLGTIATNSNFTYTDDQFKPENEGAIVSNVNASFDTSIQQYLDLTLRFPSAGNSLTVTTAVIERIY
tara:strand:+ start:2366 stop:4282 length:1917 start_codon:yes stop_codon:yes gene_type:complete